MSAEGLHYVTKHEGDDDLVEFGPQFLELVPLTELRELQQVREEYDPAGIEELATSLEHPESIFYEDMSNTELTKQFDLKHPLVVARLDQQSYRNFVKEHAEYYGIEPVALEDEPAEGEVALLLIAGHRRKRAVALKSLQRNIPLDEVGIVAHVYDNIDFDEALSHQLRENIHTRTSPQEEARAIERYFRHEKRRSAGKSVTIASIARSLGFGTQKVSDALAFASLPVKIQSYVDSKDKQLAYGVVRSLKPLYDAYGELHDLLNQSGDHPQLKEDYCCDELIIMANKLAGRNFEENSVKAQTIIKNTLEEIRAKIDPRAVPLFEMQAESARDRRNRSYGNLGKKAVSALRHIESHDALQYLSDQDKAAIMNLAEELSHAALQEAYTHPTLELQ